jgi:hypothetical protein
MFLVKNISAKILEKTTHPLLKLKLMCTIEVFTASKRENTFTFALHLNKKCFG